MVTQVIGYPQVNAGAYYVNNLNVGWVSTTVLSVATGAARDSTNVNDIVVSSALAINTAVQGAGGLDVGTIANSTFYAVYVIASSLYANPAVLTSTQVSTMANGSNILNGIVISEGVVAQPGPTVNNNPPPAAMLSLSAVNPTLPEGYDMFRRVGYVLTDGSAHVLEFLQIGNGSAKTMWYDIAIQVLNAGASATYVAVPLTVAVPPGVGNTNVTFDVILDPAAAGDTVNLKPTGSTSTNGFAIMSGDVISQPHEDSIVCPAALNTGELSVDYKVAGTATLNVTAYVDQL